MYSPRGMESCLRKYIQHEQETKRANDERKTRPKSKTTTTAQISVRVNPHRRGTIKKSQILSDPTPTQPGCPNILCTPSNSLSTTCPPSSIPCALSPLNSISSPRSPLSSRRLASSRPREVVRDSESGKGTVDEKGGNAVADERRWQRNHSRRSKHRKRRLPHIRKSRRVSSSRSIRSPVGGNRVAGKRVDLRIQSSRCRQHEERVHVVVVIVIAAHGERDLDLGKAAIGLVGIKL